jgi:HK97 family phage prohead protease
MPDPTIEHKSVNFEVKDFSKDSRTAIIAHAVYNNIDLVGDISTKGMFNSSWARKDPIDFYFNHDPEKVPGKVVKTFEDETKAYTQVKFGQWTMGDDVMEMVDFGVVKGASFGYETEKKDFIVKGNKKIRKLLQVKHLETSLLTIRAANPLAGVVSLTKALNPEELKVFRNYISNMETFCRNSRASDDCIKGILKDIEEVKSIISSHDTEVTRVTPDGTSSVTSFSNALRLLTLKI